MRTLAARIGLVVLVVLLPPCSASAASISITAPASVGRGAPLTLRDSGVAPPNGRSAVYAYVQSVSDGACPAQYPEFDAPSAWGFAKVQAPTPGAPFSYTWKPDYSSEQPLGRYYACAWILTDYQYTTAVAQAPLTLRPPILRLSVSVPRHARVGTRGTFTVTGALEAPARVGILLLPSHAHVCNLDGDFCPDRRLSHCPTRYNQADNLASGIQVNATPFLHADFGDNPFHGRVRFRRRLKALSPGTFHLCAYALENVGGYNPRQAAEGHAFAAFRVTR